MRNFSLSENLLAQMAQGNGVGSAIVKGIDQGRARGQIRSDRRQASEQLALENKRADATASNQAETLRMKQQEFVMAQKEFSDKQALAEREAERESVSDRKGKEFVASYKNNLDYSDSQKVILDGYVAEGDYAGAAKAMQEWSEPETTPMTEYQKWQKQNTLDTQAAESLEKKEEKESKEREEQQLVDIKLIAIDKVLALTGEATGEKYDPETDSFVNDESRENLINEDNTGFFDKWVAARGPLSKGSEGELRRNIEKMKSNLILDELKALKAEGATLGQITEKELLVLESADVNLDQASSWQELEREYKKVRSALLSLRRSVSDSRKSSNSNEPDELTPDEIEEYNRYMARQAEEGGSQ